MKCVQNCIVFSKRCSNCLFLRCVDYRAVGVVPSKIGCGFSFFHVQHLQESVPKRIFPFQLHLEEVKGDFLLWLQFSNQRANSCQLIFIPHKVGMYKVRTRHFESKSGNLKKQVCQKYMWTDGHSALT